MKNLVIIFSIFALVILSTACGDRKKDKEFEELVDKAASYSQNNDLISAKEIYSKALDLKEDDQVRGWYNSILKEIESAKEVNKYRDSLRELKKEINKAFNEERLNDLTILMSDLYDDIKSTTLDKETKAGSYLDGLKNSPELNSLGTEAQLTIYSAIQNKTDLKEAKEQVQSIVDNILSYHEYPFDNVK